MTGDRSDPPTYLVAGGARVDAGKTTFSAGLVAHLADRAGDAVGVKPRAGNDLWFDHDDYLIATDAARLYGKDARTLAAANTRALAAADDGSPSPSAVTPESINPVHRLWRPTPGRTGMLGDAERTFLCDRVTTASGTRFVVNGAAEEAGLLPDALTDRLPLAEATRVRDVPAFNEVMAEAHLPAIERLADRVARTPVPVVVESYADVAGTLPRDGPVAPDAVAVVDPGRARLYAGDRYAKARAVAAGSPREGTREEHVDAVTEMIEPLATVSLPALSGDVRGDPDRIAAAYEPAYATLTDSVEN
ncbi:ATPase [Halorubrum ezzemoulense DSM 17463]|uniref:ATPase n=1 Tax=Halorubrum ezzemoulense DSM 17463 TaxID=1121945 RepID=A0A1X4H8G9_HALEZ|nr:ATPase [Halorubrum ezzemoulense]OSP07977.1 ATPase [Halorubrum ezzemoulense DSM 17463]